MGDKQGAREGLGTTGKALFDMTKSLDTALGQVPLVGKPIVELNKKLCDIGMHQVLPVSCAAIDEVAVELRKQQLPPVSPDRRSGPEHE